MSEGKLSPRGARVVKALDQFADDLDAGASIETKDTAPRVKVTPKPSLDPPAKVQAVRKIKGFRSRFGE